jgi:hypothetical protein
MKGITFTTMATAAVLALVNCAGTSNTGPTSPTPASAAVAALMVTNPAPGGSTFQLMATARLMDGSTRDVTAIATWTSSDISIATVAATGLVTVVGSGPVELRARYQNVAGSLAMQVQPGFALSGTVQEVGPAMHALSSVRLQIVNGPGTGAAVTSDAAGRFRFTNVSGVVTIEASVPGFIPWRVANLTVDRDLAIQVAMYPTPPANAAGLTATARCNDGSWTWATTVADACTANGGILYGVCPGALCAATRSIGAIR